MEGDGKTLAERECRPCRPGTPPLGAREAEGLRAALDGAWKVADGRLEREYRFPDFRTALEFTNRVGGLAEAAGHHPDILTAWGKVRLTLWTHAAGGLTENDFILAAKVDAMGGL